MQQWEYLSVLLDADAERVKDYLTEHCPAWQVSRYSPLALVPDLNEYGAQGWELISVQPVANGDDEAILVHYAPVDQQSGRIWSHSYLCAFKRPLAGQ